MCVSGAFAVSFRGWIFPSDHGSLEGTFFLVLFKVADLSPKNILGNKAATDGVSIARSKNIGEMFPPGFGGLDFSGQVYHPDNAGVPRDFLVYPCLSQKNHFESRGINGVDP